jgi:adenylate cyclase
MAMSFTSKRWPRYHTGGMLVLLLCGSGVQAQQDSLWRVWNDTQAGDSSRLSAIQTLSWKWVFEQPDSGMTLAMHQLELALSARHDEARYEAYTTLAAGSSMKGDHKLSLEYLQQCLAVARHMKDDRRVANTLSNMSNVYKNIGDMPMALDVLQKSAAIDRAVKNPIGLAGTYNNMGNIHTELADHSSALKYYERSDSIFAQEGDEKGQAQTLLNLGSALGELGDKVQALEKLMRSRSLYEAIGRKHELGMVHNSMGRIRGKLGETEAAMQDLHTAHRYLEEVGNKRTLARNLFYQGEIQLALGRVQEALDACTKGLQLAMASGSLLQQRECLDCLVKAHALRGDHRSAFFAQQEHLLIADSISRLNNGREVTRLEVTRAWQERQIADSLANVRAMFEQVLAHQEEIAIERSTRNVLLFSGVGVLLVATGLWNRLRFVRRSRRAIQLERDRSDELLHNILPREVAAELKEKGMATTREYQQVTILFTDFVGFTEMSSRTSPVALVAELNICFKAFDAIMERHGVEKIKTIGDAYMAAAGVPDPGGPGAHQIVHAALEMQEFLAERTRAIAGTGSFTFRMRAGLHTGTVVAGIVGDKKFAYDIWGDTVNVAARMESSGMEGQVNISTTTYEHVRHATDLRFTPRGMIAVKGKGELEMFLVERVSGSVPDDLSAVPGTIRSDERKEVDPGILA